MTKGNSILPYSTIRIKDKFLITSKLGSWTILNKEEMILIAKNTLDNNLKTKLEDAGILVSEINIKKTIRDYANMNQNLFNGTSLHIIALNSKCNQQCVYCHASTNENKSIDKETTIKVLNMIFQSNSNALTIEFQGGECLMDFEMVKFIVTEVKNLNKLEKKKLKFMLCTNLTLMDDNMLKFAKENNIIISTSLDGPEEIHNKNRPFLDGRGTFEDVVSRIKKIKKEYGQDMVGALPTITKHTLPYHKELIDTYVNLGFEEIYIRFLNYLGGAKKNWKEIGYTPEEFLDFWKKSLDYIINLNKKGVKIKERFASSFLSKILKKQDPWNTEMMSPCGAGRCQILYDYDGSVYTCDEARTLGEDIFKLGDLNKSDYSDIMGSDILFNICNASIIDNFCPTCAFSPWCATCPVINYSEQGSVIPKIKQTMKCKIYFGVFKHLFELIQDPEIKKIFEKWIN